MRTDYAEIIRALAGCTFNMAWEFQLVGDLNDARYNERAKPLSDVQRRTLRQLTKKYRRQLAPEIVALAATLEPAK